MRHLKRGRKLGRTSAHRKALRQNLAIALFTHGRIITTMAKAKEYRPFVEKLITLAKKGIVEKDGENHERYLHCYRRAISMLQDKVIAKKGVTAREASQGDKNTDVYRRYLHCYRRAISILQDKDIAKKLFDEIAPGYMERSGGYTRILKDSKRRLGDNAPRAVFELVEFSAVAEEPVTKKGKKKK